MEGRLTGPIVPYACPFRCLLEVSPRFQSRVANAERTVVLGLPAARLLPCPWCGSLCGALLKLP